jgi:hypothetical protein
MLSRISSRRVLNVAQNARYVSASSSGILARQPGLGPGLGIRGYSKAADDSEPDFLQSVEIFVKKWVIDVLKMFL